MTRVLLFLLTLLLVPLHAAAWQDDANGCAVNLPESAGWQAMPAMPEGSIPGLRVLVSMQQPSRGAVFGVTVLTNPPSLSLRDKTTQQAIEVMLRGFGYSLAGSATTTIGGLEWRQYNVRSETGGEVATGVVRYTSGNGRIYAVTLLVGGGREAAQDLELQSAASSFRLFAAAASAPIPPSAVAGNTPGAANPASVPGAPGPSAGKPEASPTIAFDPMSLAIPVGAGVLLLVLLIFLFSGKKK